MKIALESPEALFNEDLETMVTVWARKPIEELLFNQLYIITNTYMYLFLLVLCLKKLQL